MPSPADFMFGQPGGFSPAPSLFMTGGQPASPFSQQKDYQSFLSGIEQQAKIEEDVKGSMLKGQIIAARERDQRAIEERNKFFEKLTGQKAKKTAAPEGYYSDPYGQISQIPPEFSSKIGGSRGGTFGVGGFGAAGVGGGA
jgi:hypothetical protein